MLRQHQGKILVLLIAVIAIIAVIGSAIFGDNINKLTNDNGNITFFNQFVLAGGPIVWFVLLPMSMCAIYQALDMLFTITQKKLCPSGVAENISSLINQLPSQRWMIEVNKKRDFVSSAVMKIISSRFVNRNEIDKLLEDNIEHQAMAIWRKIDRANIIGGAAPMVGLFGTVFGMIKAFNGIIIAGGQPEPAQLAEGISVALVTTFWGLLVAIPAVVMAGIFRNKLERITSEAISESHLLIPQLRQQLKQERIYIKQLVNQNKNQTEVDETIEIESV